MQLLKVSPSIIRHENTSLPDSRSAIPHNSQSLFASIRLFSLLYLYFKKLMCSRQLNTNQFCVGPNFETRPLGQTVGCAEFHATDDYYYQLTRANEEQILTC